MEPTYLVFNCRLEGRQLREGEQGLLAAREVVQAICDADFRDHSLDLVNPMTNKRYHHEYVKPPENKLYLMRVVNPENRLSLDVVVDTRMYPNYILIEKDQHRAKDSYVLAKIMQHSLDKAAEAYGWNLKMKKNSLNEIYSSSILSAMAFANNLPSEESQQVLIENNFHGEINNINING